MTRRWFVGLLGLLLPLLAAAHKPSDSYLALEGGTLRWDIALRDLEYALGLDADGDGAITWGELRAGAPAVLKYAGSHLRLEAGSDPCTLEPGPEAVQVERHSDGAYAVLRFAVACPGGAVPTALTYRLLFELDPTHRGLLRVDTAVGTWSAVLAPERPRLELPAAPPGAGAVFADYWRDGVWHIWIGFDHILFLLALLLPAVLWREAGRWRPAERFLPVLAEVAGIVTAFTVAHSITLALAALGWVELPSRLVESAIAATVALAGLNNLYPLVPTRRWAMAFVLGLIHGFGFAGVLGDLGLPPEALLTALAGFNLGVETGQLAIVLGFLPIAYALRATALYRRGIFVGGSAAVVAIATLWLLQRSLDLSL